MMSGTTSVVSSDSSPLSSWRDGVVNNVLNDWACATFSPNEALSPEQNQLNLTLRLALAFEDHSEWRKNVRKDERKREVCTAYVLELSKEVYLDQGIVFVMRKESSDLRSRNDRKIEYQAVLANVRGGQSSVDKVFLRGLDAKEIFEALDVREQIVEKALNLRDSRGRKPWRISEDCYFMDVPQITKLSANLDIEGKQGDIVVTRTLYNSNLGKNLPPEEQFEIVYSVPTHDSASTLVINFHAAAVKGCFEEVPD